MRLKTIAFILAAISLLAIFSSADLSPTITRRALIIGINEYEPPVIASLTLPGSRPLLAFAGFTPSAAEVGRGHFRDLDGCVNDAQGMQAILIARFGFKDE